MDCKSRTSFKLELFYTGKKFIIKDALVVQQFSDDIRILPHSVDISALENFAGTHVPVVHDRKGIDILIGQSDKQLLTASPAPRESIPGTCPPKRELYPPSEDSAPKKVTGPVPLECSSRPETPKVLVITPEFVSKNCFFADFAIKTLFSRSLPQNS